ncbi:MAG TPA: BON domain-containing protein [Acidimicrobiales bacterium]|nr:BON domain-containing protein [Acidimicrobiales bacterium]
MKIVLFPIKVTGRSIRWVGLRRLALMGVGATLALLLTPTTGAEMRARLSGLVTRRVPDADLAARVRHELSHSPRTWHLPQPSVSVLQGRVVLAGEAPHATGRADLERVVASVPGVVSVENEIIVA